ncbi:hypothetical protein RUM43_008782 [Polyplax serrata]|uniref:NADH dehydrogenase [ubiquinone] 1 alpha subcomplex subunit 10, mitochondrial n=1 Tax=Polyplax serrata TaxID=468196 RepID=A0AAN8NN90_POLSC
MVPLQVHNVKSILPKTFKFGPLVVQKANMTGRGTRGCPLKLMKPYPYQDEKFSIWTPLFDDTLLRVSQENAKIIVIEGPIAAGKTALAKALAEEFDLLHIPEATANDEYVLPFGFDVRQNDHLAPRPLQIYDHKNFCTNPTDLRSALFQYLMLRMRYYQYVDALAHLLNTGQGVILERSVFSDWVFMQAMYEQKFVSKNVYNEYFNIKRNISTRLLEPHLIIYLDVPVPVVQERIRTRNYSYEQNSPALTKEYLTSLDKHWKLNIQQQSKNSEVLIYNWSDGGEMELIAEDIEKLDLQNIRKEKLLHWKISSRLFNKLRAFVTNEKYSFDSYFKYDVTKVPELDFPGYLVLQRNKIYDNIPESKYDIGYNPANGDSFWKILLNCKSHKHRISRSHLPYKY